MTLLQVTFVLAILHSATHPAMKSPGQTSSPDSKPYCVTRLLVPSFPYIAKTSNSSGTLLAIVRLDHEGAVQSQQIDAVSSPGGSYTVKAFKLAIEQALKASSFSKTCAGETVRLIFRFTMGAPDAVWFEYPNTYEITALPLPLNKKR